MVPSLNPTANRKISVKGHLQAANLASLLGVTKNFNGNEEKSVKIKETTDQFSRENSYGAYIELKQSRADKFPSLDQ